MANFDQNSWYQVFIDEDPTFSMSGYITFSKGRGTIIITQTNYTDPSQQWQFFPFNSSYYVLRTNYAGEYGYLGAGLSSVASTSPGNTSPLMLNVTNSDASMFWAVSPWGDGTFYLTNAGNGTDWHLNNIQNGLLSMSSNITAPQNAQRFSFDKQGLINDIAFSSVSLPAALSTTSSTPTSTPSSISTSSSTSTTPILAATTSSRSSGLSTGAKAGIGIGVALGAIVGLLLLGFWALRRRKRRHQPPTELPEDPAPTSEEHANGDTVMSGDTMMSHELDPATRRFEMEAGKDKYGNPKDTSPYDSYRPGVGMEQKLPMLQSPSTGAEMQEMPSREIYAHEMDASPRILESSEMPGDGEERAR